MVLKHYQIKKYYSKLKTELDSEITATAITGLLLHRFDNRSMVEIIQDSKKLQHLKEKRYNLYKDYIDSCKMSKIKPSNRFIRNLINN